METKEKEKKSKAKREMRKRDKSVESDVYEEDDGEDECIDVAEDITEEPGPIIAVRSNFNPLANFTPAVQVGEDGATDILVKIPDNLTRYRSASA